MKAGTISNLMELLTGYEQTKRNKLGAPILVDHLLLVTEDVGKTTSEGMVCKEHKLLIYSDQPLPYQFEVRTVKDEEGKLHKLHVMAIKSLNWGRYNGELGVVVTILGIKEEVEQDGEEEKEPAE